MRLTYTPVAGAAVDLHDLGYIYIASQQSSFEPSDLPQRETVLLTVRIELWRERFVENYNLVTQVRDALKQQIGRLTWRDEDEVDDEDTFQGPGEVYLDQDVTLVDQDLPENPNSWGTTQQSITIRFRYEVNDLASDATHLGATFTPNGASSQVLLGHVFGFTPNFKTKYYSEMRNLRERASGSVSMNGVWFANAATNITNRRGYLLARVAEMKAAINDKDGLLTYGPGGSVFNQVVRVEAFEAKIDQATFSIAWSLTAIWTVFPDEAGYAAAQFTVRIAEDDEPGEVTLTLNGKIGAPTEVLALAKLALIRTASVTDGFTIVKRLSKETDSHFVDCDDGKSFMELTFSETYRKRGADIESHNIQITESDETRTGLVTRTYSGWVMATAATDSAAYAAALAMARDLGDNKHPFRISGVVTRNDRKINTGAQEFVRLEFSYSYQTKGNRSYLEAAYEVVGETFGENQERVSGFVVAKDLATARADYLAAIRNAYDGRLIRNETTTESKQMIGNGTYANGAFSPQSTRTTMGIRFDFAFSVFKTKATGEFSFKYGIEVDVDYTTLRKASTVSGRFYGSAALMAAAAAGTAGNKIDVFLATFALGKLVNTRRRQDKEKVGDAIDELLCVDFSNSYSDRITSPNQILSCELTETIKYSGERMQFQPTPDGEDVEQECGTERGERTVQGSVVAATETAARAWMKRMHALPYPSGNGGGTPTAGKAIEYPHPQVTSGFETVPLTELTPRGDGANAQFSKLTFTFSWQLLSHPYVEV